MSNVEVCVVDARKITKKEMFNRIMVAMAENEEIVAFCQHEIELLEKKANKSRNSKGKQENEVIKNEILEILASAENPMTVGNLMVALGNRFSNQKITALVSALVKEEKVERIVEKRVAYFALAE